MGEPAENSSRLVTGKRRDALGLLLDAVDAVIEDGIPHRDGIAPTPRFEPARSRRHSRKRKRS
jgi:hypothetical protein